MVSAAHDQDRPVVSRVAAELADLGQELRDREPGGSDGGRSRAGLA